MILELSSSFFSFLNIEGVQGELASLGLGLVNKFTWICNLYHNAFACSIGPPATGNTQIVCQLKPGIPPRNFHFCPKKLLTAWAFPWIRRACCSPQIHTRGSCLEDATPCAPSARLTSRSYRIGRTQPSHRIPWTAWCRHWKRSKVMHGSRYREAS